MKVRNYTSLSIAASSLLAPSISAWTVSPTGTSSFLPSTTRASGSSSLHSKQQPRFLSSTAMGMSAAIEEEEGTAAAAATATKPSYADRTIAEGAVISYFPGGLVAIKINEDFESDKDAPVELTVDGLTTDGRRTVTAAGKSSTEVGDYQGKEVVFSNGDVGVVVAHRPPLAFVYSNLDSPMKDGRVEVLNTVTKIKVSPDKKVIDCFGRSLNAKNNDSNTGECLGERAMFAAIPQIKDIALINYPMLTGVTMIDTLASVGRGQNMLLVGHNRESMRALATDFLSTQCKIKQNTKLIYASTEESAETVLQRFETAGISDQVQVVAPRKQFEKKDIDGASKAAEAVSIAATACAIGEMYALENGMHSLVIVDTIDQHKKMWDTTTKVLVDVFGVDAVVKSDRDGAASSEMRGFFSSLIQRAGQYKEKRGGGSVTLLLLVTIPTEVADEDAVFSEKDFENAPQKVKDRIDILVKKNIPLTAGTLRKINIPVPSALEGERRFALQHVDDLISMSDGQIWLDERLEASGRQPPVDPQRSVTRIGIGADTQSRADAPALRRIVEGLRLELSQAASMDGAEATIASKKQARRQQALFLAMHQIGGTGGRRLSESCIALLAAKEGHLDKAIEEGALAGTEKGDKVLIDLLAYMQKEVTDVMNRIDASTDMSDADQRTLHEAIEAFFSM